MSLKPKFLATGIGSVPFTDADYAVETLLSRLPESPFWPQLPRLGLNEQMQAQYSESLPCIQIDRENNRLYFDTTGDYTEAFAAFYEAYILAMDPDAGTGDCSAMAIGPEFSKGIYAFEKHLKTRTGKLPFVKVQTTGPCSFALSVTDQDRKFMYYYDDFRDVIVKALSMKCRWQIQKFQSYAEKVICFLDEPVLSAYGSSTYISVMREDIVAMLNETIEAIHQEDALAAIHCCGNTEWSILIDAGCDIVNFDAFEFGETIAMYPEAVAEFLHRGGLLAWGVVPTSVAVREQTVASLAEHLEKLMGHLAAKCNVPKQMIAEQAIITPACGTGVLEPEDAERVFELTSELSGAMKLKYGF
ncbi:MAG: uroporphyrinogen decarboxylase/cobalamine-independent methonine synthase family protein [Planctomycetota bacterium]|jgi:methionine synthase II (cobalamin-independent)